MNITPRDGSLSAALLSTLVDAGVLHEQCACGCNREHHALEDGAVTGFCHVCWSDNCNYYRPVFVVNKRAAEDFDREHAEPVRRWPFKDYNG
jgi:hypothetical protein